MLGISSSEELYAADHRAVTYWEKYLREVENLEPSTIRRRLSALSSLFTHLVDYGVVKLNPVREIKRPELDRSEGKTLAFSRQEARKILDKPDATHALGKRDRAILSVGFQAGFRREEIANLQVDSLHKNRGLDALWVKRKRKRNRQSVTINPQTATRIRDYLDTAGHGDDLSGPLFRPVRNNGRGLVICGGLCTGRHRSDPAKTGPSGARRDHRVLRTLDADDVCDDCPGERRQHRRSAIFDGACGRFHDQTLRSTGP